MKYAFNIVFVIPGLPFDGSTLETKSLGGSETAAICVAKELAHLGHQVTVFSNCPKPDVYDKVQYLSIQNSSRYLQEVPHDICIVQRTPEIFGMHINSRLNILWCHDLALGRDAAKFKSVLWNVDRVFVLSKFMKKQWERVYELPETELLWVTRNGIELDRINKALAQNNKRIYTDLIYSARPERGLDLLLEQILPKLLSKNPNIRLLLCGYHNPVSQLQSFYENINLLIANFGDKVIWLGNLTKDQLYTVYTKVGVYVYPTPSPSIPRFAEISCISAMEAQALGLPIVTSKKGALPETIHPDAGILIKGDSTSEIYQEQFCDAVLKLISDKEEWTRKSVAGKNHGRNLGWREVAEQWSEQFQILIENKTRNKYSLAYHFIKRSDIVAVQSMIDSKILDDIKEKIKDWDFAKTKEGRIEQYNKIGQTHTDVFEQSCSELRYQSLRDWLIRHPDIQRILDFGCSHGSYAINLANELGREWVCVDIDKYSIELAEKWKKERAKNPNVIKFIVGDETVDLSDEAPFDLLLITETLEHLPKPWEAVNQLEKWIKPGKYVYISTPYGSWESLSYKSYPYRAHLWEFDRHDLFDMFGKKKSFSIYTLPFGYSPETSSYLGWHIVEYLVNGNPCGEIDINRKITIQAPKQTLSILIIAGQDCETALHWCLRSVESIADEIVIANTGMSEEALRIANQYPTQIIKASNPIIHGFETPRNEALAHCRMDWVLWIDSDERLINPQNILKYLRANIFDGYGIRQHHFACDATFNPDTPIRLFRRISNDGRSMRWFGMIHEHPEFSLNEGPGHTLLLSDVHIAHIGYLSEPIRRERFARNYPLLQKDIEKYPERLLQKHFIMRDNILLAQYELSANGGQVTKRVKQLCEETIKIYREYFLGKNPLSMINSLQYYSQALAILGEGFEVQWALAAHKHQTSLNGSKIARFASVEDLQRELAFELQNIATPYNEDW